MKFYYQKSGVSQSEIENTIQLIASYVKHVQEVSNAHTYDAVESSINLPIDSSIVEKVIEVKKSKVSSQLKYIIDIGIGGSNLGTKAVYDALHGFYDTMQVDRFPKIIFLDTTDEDGLVKLESLISQLKSKDQILVNTISKSGSTTETIGNFEIMLQALLKKFPDALDRVVITSDEGSKLWNAAQEKGITILPLPKQVGGRYSIFSAVGLFPLASCGINIEALLQGAQKMREQSLKEGIENPALVSAAVLYLNNQKGKVINDNFFFIPSLESVGKWYRQLMGESIGKEHDLDGKVVHAGITPTVSIGSTDMHSVGQLYFGGPQDKITTFVWKEKQQQEVYIPEKLHFPLVPHIEKKSVYSVMWAISEGVKKAYENDHMPFMEAILEQVDEKELGAYLQFKMIEMMYLAKLLNVNAFDQPHVELYKIEMKKILEKS